MSQYKTIYARVPTEVYEKLDEFKEKNGLPSNSQAIAAMVGFAASWQVLVEMLQVINKDKTRKKSNDWTKTLN
ncbi:MAG: hypothetical protein ACREBU_10630, partial [Nitrososphaera sp.]